MAKYKVGIIGYGWAAGAHVDAINACPDAEVVAICSSRPLDAAELEERHGSTITPYREVKKLLADENVNVVDVCSYPYQHARHVIAAAEAGKQVIVEKPLALSLKDVYAMQKAVNKAGVSCCVCFEVWYSSQFLATKAVIDKGLLGNVHYGEIDYYHGVGPWYGQYR